jgi:hypothetical protein
MQTQEKPEVVKTSIAIRKDLWRGLKIAILDEGVDMATILNRLVEQYLAQRERPKRGRR